MYPNVDTQEDNDFEQLLSVVQHQPDGFEDRCWENASIGVLDTN